MIIFVRSAFLPKSQAPSFPTTSPAASHYDPCLSCQSGGPECVLKSDGGEARLADLGEQRWCLNTSRSESLGTSLSRKAGQAVMPHPCPSRLCPSWSQMLPPPIPSSPHPPPSPPNFSTPLPALPVLGVLPWGLLFLCVEGKGERRREMEKPGQGCGGWRGPV